MGYHIGTIPANVIRTPLKKIRVLAADCLLFYRKTYGHFLQCIEAVLILEIVRILN